MQEHVKIQAVRNWNNPVLNWLSCLLCLHRLHCLLGGWSSCCLHRLLCHDVECLENRVTLLRLQLSPWAMPHDELCLAHVTTCCSASSNMHNAYTWTWATMREAPMGYLVPGRVWHGAWTTLLYNINTWNLCRRRFVTHIGLIFHPFPAVLAMLHPVIFAQKCSTQSVKVIPYVSLYLYVFPIIWHIPVCPCPLPLRTLAPIPWGLLLIAFAKNLAEDQHGSKPCPSSQVWAGSKRLGPGHPCSEVV